MASKTYNGWTNYETWVTSLWLDNEESSAAYWNEEARDCWRSAPQSERVLSWDFSRQEAARLELAERLKLAINEGCPDLAATLYADLMGAALCEIEWEEIADHYIDAVTVETVETRKGKQHDG